MDMFLPDDARKLYEKLISDGSRLLPGDLETLDSTARTLLEHHLAVISARRPPELAAVMPAEAFEQILLRWRRSVQSLREALVGATDMMIAFQERAVRSGQQVDARSTCQILVRIPEINALMRALYAAAEHAVDSWAAGPYGEPKTLPDGDDHPRDAVRAFVGPEHSFVATGGRARCVYDREYVLRYPFMPELAATHGEDARVFDGKLPMKLLLFDDHTALLPLGPYGRPALLVRDRTLVGCWRAFYDLVWEQATPLTPEPGRATPDGIDQRVLELMAAGLKDDAIARQCGVSTRTVRRHIARLMGELGTTTRFAAGVAAARRKLIGTHSG